MLAAKRATKGLRFRQRGTDIQIETDIGGIVLIQYSFESNSM